MPIVFGQPVAEKEISAEESSTHGPYHPQQSRLNELSVKCCLSAPAHRKYILNISIKTTFLALYIWRLCTVHDGNVESF